MATTRVETKTEKPVQEQPKPETALALLSPELTRVATELDHIREECSLAIEGATGHMVRALLTARGVMALRNALTNKVMAEIMPLMNCPLGFLTDRGPGKKGGNETPYSVEVVRDVVVEAMLNGLYLTGNEFNILAGRCYGTQNGYKRKLEDVPGITDIAISPGIPATHNGLPVCRIALSWILNGKADMLRGPDGKPGQPFPLISHGSASPDQLVGKAKRKAYKLAYEQATGSKCTIEDREVGEPMERLPVAGNKSDQVLGALTGKNGDTEYASPAQNQQIDGLCIDLEMDQAVFNEKCAEIGADPARPTKVQAEALIAWLLEKANAGQEQPA